MINKRKIIADKIKKARKELNLSQKELAKILNYKDQSNISKIESGKVSIDADRIGDFSRALKKNIIYFLSDI